MTKMNVSHRLSFGAELLADGRACFRLWAPDRTEVTLEIAGQPPQPMRCEAGGWFIREAVCEAGALYRFRLGPDGLAVPDPAARAQAGGLGPGFSKLVDPKAYEWKTADWTGRPWAETVFYEAHVGALGGFRGVAEKLPYLASLGITALELMPVAEFPGERNWGYDGVLPYAPSAAYGSPDELKALVDAAHAHGLTIFLDVVYNHFGPVGNYLNAYASSFFRHDISMPWGAAIDFRHPEVRDFFIENAIYWLTEYRFDGLRLDAVHAIGDPEFLKELATRVHASVEPGRHVHLVLENDDNDAGLLDRHFDAQWNDDGHHALHVLLTGETQGYYGDYAEEPIAKLARCLSSGFAYQGEPSPHRGGATRGSPSGHLPPTSFVLFLQNHDQIGNRALGERLAALADPMALEAATALLLLCPQIPLLFMGEEWGSRAPFLFFVHHDEVLAKAVREGRQREFASFPAFKDETRRALIPDPNEMETFLSSCPDFLGVHDPLNEGRIALVKNLLKIRHAEIVPRLKGALSEGVTVLSPKALEARWRMGDGATLSLAVNLSETEVEAAPPSGRAIFNLRDPLPTRFLPPRSFRAFIEAAP
ncbi:MAG: malto-oligosyltrehalose trehalohydrolase [Parvibaculum sp.]|uniref:malto-oligosyltrehalose trehalohydrolase n=1 Tax=Parvibaculum sp. TaxID=2024848 RepID=UPI0025E6D3F4|nr:malto-oligosyltrehalose trehalohydrolase [Parvibaculum sp.]MCE9649795.1 malto-oligosyltrehalose trehalohydrolase [Parvibaculum sp.]